MWTCADAHVGGESGWGPQCRLNYYQISIDHNNINIIIIYYRYDISICWILSDINQSVWVTRVLEYSSTSTLASTRVLEYSSTRVLEYPGIRIDIINNCLSTITVITYTESESDYYLMYYS